jgi:hypothetical protein
MTPQFEVPEGHPNPVIEPDEGDLFLDLFAGSIAEAKATFDHYMEELDILPYLKVMPTRIHSWARGCPMLLTKVNNPNWGTKRARKTTGGGFVVEDATRFYDVHMEVGVKLGTTKLVVLVHHETSPYIVESKLETVVDAEVAKNYRRRRRDFVEEFHRLCVQRKEEIPALRLARQWMLIGSAEYDFNRKTLAEVSNWLAFMIDEITDVINWTIFRLDARARFIAESDAAVIEPNVMPATDEANPVTVVIEITDQVPFTNAKVPFSAES